MAKRKSSKRRTLDRRLIAEKALQLIDAEGLDWLSMRRLGAALGVEAMALYHHFENKAELLDGVLELLIDEVEPALATKRPPLARLRRAFEAVRTIAVTHPRAFLLVATRRFRTERALQFYERLLETFAEAGFDARQSAILFRVAAGFVTGAGMAEVGSRAMQADATPILLEDFADAERFPRITAVVPYLRVDKLGAIFDFGLDLIFDAMRAELGPRGTRRKP